MCQLLCSELKIQEASRNTKERALSLSQGGQDGFTGRWLTAEMWGMQAHGNKGKGTLCRTRAMEQKKLLIQSNKKPSAVSLLSKTLARTKVQPLISHQLLWKDVRTLVLLRNTWQALCISNFNQSVSITVFNSASNGFVAIPPYMMLSLGSEITWVAQAERGQD